MLVSLSIAHSLVHSVSLIPSCRYTSTCSKKLGLQGVTHFNVSVHLLIVYGTDESGRVKKSCNRWCAVSQTSIRPNFKIQTTRNDRERKGYMSRCISKIHEGTESSRSCKLYSPKNNILFLLLSRRLHITG
jgi:hypothetical protein